MQKANLDKDKEEELKRKVFVGGISKTTNEADLEAHFSKFGEIEDILVNRSAKNGASKGCAFILFKDMKVAQQLIISSDLHLVDGKEVECKASHKKGTKRRRLANQAKADNEDPQSQPKDSKQPPAATPMLAKRAIDPEQHQPANQDQVNISNISVHNSETKRGSCRHTKGSDKRIDFDWRCEDSKLSLILAATQRVAWNISCARNIRLNSGQPSMTYYVQR